MLALRALLITIIAMSGIAIVLWLVSLITGASPAPMSLVLAGSFVLVATWAYLGLKHHHQRGNGHND